MTTMKMMTIKADLTAITRSGLLQARVSTLEPKDSHLVAGDRLVVIDLFGSERFEAVVESIDGESGTVLLDVNWDAEPPAVISGHVGRSRYGMSFGSRFTVHAEGNHVRSVKRPAPAQSA
jgi:hypothetical protein